MDFAPEFAPDAQSQWRELDDTTLQDLVWDAVEDLARNPPPVAEYVADFIHPSGDGWHYIFISINIDHAKCKLTVAGVNRYFRPKAG
jgi:hypothetical protein